MVSLTMDNMDLEPGVMCEYMSTIGIWYHMLEWIIELCGFLFLTAKVPGAGAVLPCWAPHAAHPRLVLILVHALGAVRLRRVTVPSVESGMGSGPDLVVWVEPWTLVAQ